MNDLAELHALIARVNAGDKSAVDTAVELAGRMVLMQELANAPAGIREMALAAHAQLWKARRAKTNRSKATAKSNKARGERNKALVEDTVQLIGADTADHAITGMVRKHLKRNGKPLSENTIRKTVKH